MWVLYTVQLENLTRGFSSISLSAHALMHHVFSTCNFSAIFSEKRVHVYIELFPSPVPSFSTHYHVEKTQEIYMYMYTVMHMSGSVFFKFIIFSLSCYSSPQFFQCRKAGNGPGRRALLHIAYNMSYLPTYR